MEISGDDSLGGGAGDRKEHSGKRTLLDESNGLPKKLIRAPHQSVISNHFKGNQMYTTLAKEEEIIGVLIRSLQTLKASLMFGKHGKGGTIAPAGISSSS